MLHDSGGLLGRFVALRDAPDDQIAAFARLYGVLGICKHGRPWPHAEDMASGHLLVCPWVRRGDDGGAEPLAAWRALAAQAAALLGRQPGRRMWCAACRLKARAAAARDYRARKRKAGKG